VLDDICTVARPTRINSINGFHSYMKDQIRHYRGVATIYLNRYNALFATAYANMTAAKDTLFALITQRDNSFETIEQTKSDYLLAV